MEEAMMANGTEHLGVVGTDGGDTQDAAVPASDTLSSPLSAGASHDAPVPVNLTQGGCNIVVTRMVDEGGMSTASPLYVAPVIANVSDAKSSSIAVDTPVTVDLSHAGPHNTGHGTATFSNIKGLVVGSGHDTFTDSMAGNNQFEGRGGNDTFNLIHGGHDTLLYHLLNAADATGGNGQDQVNGFTVGTFEATPTADRIDLAALLVGYTPTQTSGPAHYINGAATIDSGDPITNYLSVSHVGNNTVVNIDMHGTGNYTPLVTLNNVNVSLETLLANHQIVV
jgi:hypothetical protein